MRQMRLLIMICILSLVAMAVQGAGSIATGSLSPQQVSLCGSGSQYVTLTAASVHNKENATVAGLSARLVVPSQAGLSFITSQQVYIGDVGPQGTYPQVAWTVQCASPVAGIYTLYIAYNSTNGFSGSSIDEAVSMLTISTAQQMRMNVSIIKGTPSTPTVQNLPLVNDNTPTLKVTTSINAACRGSLDADRAYDSSDFIFYGTEKSHEYTFSSPMADGSHIIYVKCMENGNGAITSSDIGFMLDSIAPLITVNEPAGTITDSFTEFNVSINEAGECRYSSSDKGFDSMSEFDDAGETSFRTSITDLDPGEYSYYLKCRDIAGNTVSEKITINYQLPPKAQVVLSSQPPLKKGTYEVTVVPSKALRSTPTLTYTFTDDPAFSRQISLIRDGSNYRGYLVIDNFDVTRVGVFRFLAFDIQGTQGSEISDGEVFLVDTIKPEAPKSISATADDSGQVVLKWYYEGEQAESYYIYRSDVAGVDYIHYYKKISLPEFHDSDVQPGVVYNYRVAAVDAAGNIGDLSAEVAAAAKPKPGAGDKPTGSTVVADAPVRETLLKYNSTLRDMESLFLDIDWAMTSLNDLKSKESLVDELSLLKEVQDQKSELDKLKAQMVGVAGLSSTNSEYLDYISRAESLMSTIRKTCPEKLEVAKKTTYLQSVTDDDIKLAVDEFLRQVNVTERQKRDYLKKAAEIQSKIKVEAEIDTISITYLDGSVKTSVLITKKASYEAPDALTEVNLIEIIPKTVAGEVSSIDFRTPDYFVVREDPVVSWYMDTLSYDKKKIQYLILSEDKAESAKSTRTIVLPKPDVASGEGGGIITGLSIFETGARYVGSGNMLFIAFGVLLVIGLLLYYMYEVKEMPVPRVFQKIPFISRQNRPREGSAIDTAVLEKPEHYFYLRNGDIIRSLDELQRMLYAMDDATYYFHVNYERNDFANWIRGVYKNDALANQILHSKSREDMISRLGKFRS